MTCERRNRTLAHSRTRVRANNRTSVQLQSLDTTSCAIALFAWLAGAWHRANALFICRMQEVEFNIMDIIRAIYALCAYRARFDPPPSIRRAGANAKDVPTHPHPPLP